MQLSPEFGLGPSLPHQVIIFQFIIVHFIHTTQFMCVCACACVRGIKGGLRLGLKVVVMLWHYVYEVLTRVEVQGCACVRVCVC